MKTPPAATTKTNKVAALLTHERLQRIRFDGAAFLIDEQRRLEGLTRALHRRFPIHHRMQSYRSTKCSMGDRRQLDPVAHGKLVDAQISLYARYQGDFAEYRRHVAVSRLDPCTKRLIQFLHDRRWRPVAAQLPIFSDHVHIATAIDLVCEDMARPGRLIVIELKCSYHETPVEYERGRGKFVPPLKVVPRSYKNHHLLQLLMTRLILQRTYRVTPDECYLVRVCAGSIFVYPLRKQRWCGAMGGKIYQAFIPQAR